ncbi:E3 ubiquitin-protein ligase TRIM21-like [Salarias fasciatus]|uniref:E3 ubiquitin-protein ligase TRIM21-like n=1 Tax=Salarias fasciatus TaxID=181472 RepID=UPI001176EE9D|nr:E3 ubiquitin-protein ligase TRIM21-like [Salarias fasciatus]
MSLQTCHCGWSKVTTYHGLRTHQGIKGCTPKGMSIPQSAHRKLPQISSPAPPIRTQDPFFNIFGIGLTTQSMTRVLSGVQLEQGYFNGFQTEPPHQSYTPLTAVREENVILFPNLLNQTNHPPVAQPAAPLFQRNSSQMRTNWDRAPRTSLFSPALPTVTAPVNLGSPQPTVQDRSVLFFATPQHLRGTTDESDRCRRALDFSTEDQQAKQERMKADLQQKIHVRQQRKEEVRSSAADCWGCLDAEWLQINSVFSSVMKLVEEARQKALRPLEDRKREVGREAERIVQKIQREIETFEKAIGELNNNQVSSVRSLNESVDNEETGVDTSLSLGTLRAATSTMMNQIEQELEKLTSVELKRVPTFAMDVKLDPATAHRSLVVSPDGKKVKDGGTNSGVPDTAERFDLFGSILGLNGLTSGRAYWEVDVGCKSGWDLGVARRSANRKGKLELNPEEGYWVAVHFEDKMYAAMTAPPVRISPKEKPKTVGVFVDYEEGLVSFYDVKTQSHIYSFSECLFGGEICPYFSPHTQNEKNTDPLFICAV